MYRVVGPSIWLKALLFTSVSIITMVTLRAGMTIPRYTDKELAQPEVVREEIKKFTVQREEIQSKLETASALERASLRGDLMKCDQVLEMLRYVEANGYHRDDPGLQQLSYFRQFIVVADGSGAKPLPAETPAIKRDQATSSNERTDWQSKPQPEISIDGQTLQEPGIPPNTKKRVDTGEIRRKLSEINPSTVALFLLISLILGLFVGTLLLMAGLALVKGDNNYFSYVFFTVVIMMLCGIVPCAGFFLQVYTIHRRHNTGMLKAAVAWAVPLLTIILLITAFLIAFSPGWPDFRAPQEISSILDDEIVKTCNEINKKCPIIIDRETRLDTLTPGPGKSVTCNYTLVNWRKNQLDVDKLKSQVEPMLLNRARSDKEIEVLLKLGIQIKCKFSDKDGVFLFEIVVDPNT